MATVKRFEELEIWQLARVQCDAFFKLKNASRFRDDLPLEDQLNRSSGSVMDNIGEGFDRFSKAEFRQALVIARGSNAEVRSQFYRAADRNWISLEESESLQEANARIGIKIHNLIQHLLRSLYKHKPGTKDPENLSEPDITYSPDPSYNLPHEFIYAANNSNNSNNSNN